jgi:hypothetical protein
MIKNCGCYDIANGVSPDPTVRPCLNKTDQICDNFFSNHFTESNVIKTCDCPIPCSETVFRNTHSSANFPSPAFADFLISDPSFRARFANDTELNYQFLRDRIAAVNIYFNELSETVITEKAKLSVQDIISNIGGILGLFLGNLKFIFFGSNKFLKIGLELICKMNPRNEFAELCRVFGRYGSNFGCYLENKMRPNRFERSSFLRIFLAFNFFFFFKWNFICFIPQNVINVAMKVKNLDLGKNFQ